LRTSDAEVESHKIIVIDLLKEKGIGKSGMNTHSADCAGIHSLDFLGKRDMGASREGSSSKGNDRLQSIRIAIVGDIGQPCGAKVFSSHSWNGRKIRCDE